MTFEHAIKKQTVELVKSGRNRRARASGKIGHRQIPWNNDVAMEGMAFALPIFIPRKRKAQQKVTS